MIKTGGDYREQGMKINRMHYCIIYIITKLFKKESVIWNTDILNFNILVVSHAHPRETILNFYFVY